ASTKRKAFFEVVFDPVNELLYVGCTETDAAPPQVLALNARDLTVRWRYVTNFAPPNFPLLALNGTQLCFADKQNILYMFDTRDALAQADGGDGGSPKPSWRCQLPVPTDGTPYGI